MRCSVCKRAIASGVDAQKMVVEYIQNDGTTKLFGLMMPDGPLTEATGRIQRAYHSKCFHIVRKREGRGDAVTGRVLHGVPTGYEISDLVLSREEFEALGLTEEQARERGTAGLSARLERLRETARRIGKGVGDGTVLEAFWAEEKGGPYVHSHHLRLEVYQLRAHLVYAHETNYVHVVVPRGGIHELHDQLHAWEHQRAAQIARAADPGSHSPAERDWRPQVAVDIEELD